MYLLCRKCIGLALLFAIVRADAVPPAFAKEPSVAANSKATGAVSGGISYRADSKRPWRLARYYVKNSNTGALGEAVVSLVGKGIKQSSSPSDSSQLVMDQKNFQFKPEVLAIRADDRVKFLNSDKEVHNVATFHKLHAFNVTMPSGGQHTETFKHAGGIEQPYRLGCVYHSSMRGWIFVFAHPYYKVTESDGQFQFKDVPAGEYTLEVRHPAGQLKTSKAIKIVAGGTTSVDIALSPDHKPQKRSSQQK